MIERKLAVPKTVRLHDGFDYDIHLNFKNHYNGETLTIFINLNNEELDNWYGRRLDTRKDISDDDLSYAINKNIEYLVELIKLEEY